MDVYHSYLNKSATLEIDPYSIQFPRSQKADPLSLLMGEIRGTRQVSTEPDSDRWGKSTYSQKSCTLLRSGNRQYSFAVIGGRLKLRIKSVRSVFK